LSWKKADYCIDKDAELCRPSHSCTYTTQQTGTGKSAIGHYRKFLGKRYRSLKSRHGYFILKGTGMKYGVGPEGSLWLLPFAPLVWLSLHRLH
jgi:hypothetical protein